MKKQLIKIFKSTKFKFTMFFLFLAFLIYSVFFTFLYGFHNFDNAQEPMKIDLSNISWNKDYKGFYLDNSPIDLETLYVERFCNAINVIKGFFMLLISSFGAGYYFSSIKTERGDKQWQ